MGRQFEFCRVCRQNHNQGRGHRYSNKHKQCLERIQKKMLQKVQEIRRSVQNGTPVMKTAALAKFWCDFCEQEVVENSSPSFAGAEAAKHLASSTHIRNVKALWETNGEDFEKQSLYILEEKELARLDEHYQVSVGVHDTHQPPSSADEIVVPPTNVGFPLTALARVGLQPPVQELPHARVFTSQGVGFGEGNVHSGAPPPWLKQNVRQEGDGLVTGGAADGSSSDLLPLSRTQQAKLLKMRNPNRVGAAWAERRRAELAREQDGEFSSRGEAVDCSSSHSWLPNFGRVWQSGPRRDTRKEFEAEKRKSLKLQRARGERGAARKASRDFEFKPYVSRRQSKEGA
jgi:hypothetical protein